MKRRGILLWLVAAVLAVIWGVSALGPAAVRLKPAAETPSPVPIQNPSPVPSPRPVPSPSPVPVPVPVPAPTPAAEPARPPGTATRLRPSDVFPTAFEHETRDPAWAGDAESKIRAAFAEAKVPPGSLLAVECRAALCKIDMLFDRKQQFFFALAYSHLHEDFALDMGFDRDVDPTAVEPERITGYVPRKGYRMQDFAP